MNPAAHGRPRFLITQHAVTATQDDIAPEPEPSSPSPEVLLESPPAPAVDHEGVPEDLHNDFAFVGYHAGREQVGARSDLLAGLEASAPQAAPEAAAPAAGASTLVRSPEEMNLSDIARQR